MVKKQKLINFQVLKLAGKIELPVEKPKKSSDGEKRKRVRVKKVDVNKQAKANNRPGKGKKVAKKGGYVKKEVSQEDIQKEIRETLARLSGGKIEIF